MEDVITDNPPPSRFFQEDLNNFTPRAPCLPYPFILFSNPKIEKPLRPFLVIIAISPPSLYVVHHIPCKTLIGSLILPELQLSGNNIEPSLKDNSCTIYSLGDSDKFTLLVSIQCSFSLERSHSIAELLIGKQIIPQRVLILDSVQRRNFRGVLPSDEASALKIETSFERLNSLSLLKDLEYFPSGSVIDGLSAALLGRCQLRKLKGTLCISWPEYGGSVLSLIKSLLLMDHILPGIQLDSDYSFDDEYLKYGSDKDLFVSDLYT